MTLPFQAQIEQAAQPDQPAAEPTVMQRLNAVQSQHPYVDPAVQGMLASGSQSNDGILAAAQSIGQTIGSDVGSLVKAARTVFEDPVLYKTPSAALQLHQFFTQQMGWAPIQQVDLHAVQKQLQAQGYGKNLDVSGVWTSDWQDVFHQASQDHMAAQRSSNEGKGFSFGHALHGFLSAFTPSHVVPALVGAVKSFPAGLRQLAADSTGLAVNFGADLVHGNVKSLAGDTLNLVNPVNTITSYGQKPSTAEGAAAGAAVESLGNHRHVSAEQFTQEHDWRRAIENVNTILTVLPVIRLGGVVADAGGQAIAKGLFTPMAKESIVRGPGVISNMLYRPAGHYATETTADYVKGDSGLLAAKVFDHMPWLKQAMPAVRARVEGGQRFWYYTARPFAAAPYRLPIVQAAGISGQQVMFTGALLRGDANAVGKIDGNSQFAHTLQRQAPYTGPVGLALDLLGAVAHGPLTERLAFPARNAQEALTQKPAVDHLIAVKPSVQVGDLVRGAHDIYDTMLGKPGVIGAFERGTGLKYDELLTEFRKAGLDKSDLDWTLQSKVDQLAAGHGAQQELASSAARGVERERGFKEASARIRSTPELLSQARAQLLDNDTALATRFAQDHNRIITSPTAATGDMIAEAKARRVAYQLVNDPNLSWQNVHPGTFAAIRQQNAEREFAQTVGGEVPAEASATAGWLQQGNPDAPYASLGIARNDRILRTAALKQAAKFERALAKTRGPNPEMLTAQDNPAVRAVRRQMGEYLVELGIDSNQIPSDADGMLALIRERANDLAEKVHAPLNPTPEYTAARKQLNDLGYELVHGTGIGFEFTNPVIDPVLVSGGLSTVRKAAERLGLGSSYASTMDAGAWHRLATIRAWTKLENDGKVQFPPGWNAHTVYQHAYDNLPSKMRLTGVKGVAFKAAEKARWRKIAAASLPPGSTDEEITGKVAEYEKQLAEQQSLMDLSNPDFIKAITAPARSSMVNELRDLPLDAPPVTDEQAKLLQTAMVAAVAKRPAFIFGGSHLEDLLRAGGAGLAGKASTNNAVLRCIGLAGNDYVRFRNTYRFAIDPMFSFRRIVKSYLKLRTVGVPMSRHLPFETMVNQGTLAEDTALANRLFPELRGAAEGFDPLDRAIYQADLLGLYNPRHFYAYAAGWLKRMGMNDSQIKDNVTRALTYGDRTALERTVGTIFYPFSFEKTLYRQIGTRLLDEPGQRFMLAAAAQAFDALNQHDRIGHWAEKHAPILHELNKLNAFSHGVGPGQLGGINAPLASAVWNVFRPQHIGQPTNHAYDTITAAIPMISELNSLLVGYSPTAGMGHGGALTQQLGITWQEAQNLADDTTRFVFNHPRSPWNPQKPAETFQAQQDDGWALRNHLIGQLAQVIDYNYHHRGAEITFADKGVPAWLAGQSINKTTISEIVHRFYPAFDPTKPQQIAVAKKTDQKRFLTQLAAANPERANAYKAFVASADKFIGYKTNSELDRNDWATLAQYTQAYRNYAVALAEQDPTFYNFYRTYYQSQLGPLEALTG